MVSGVLEFPMSILGAILSTTCNVRYHHDDKPIYFFVSSCAWISHKLKSYKWTEWVDYEVNNYFRSKFFFFLYSHNFKDVYHMKHRQYSQHEIIFSLIWAMKLLFYQPQIPYNVFIENTDINCYNSFLILYCSNIQKFLM